MKRVVIATFLVASISLFGTDFEVQSKEQTNQIKQSKNQIQDLISIPFPGGKMFKSGKIKLSDEQKVKFATEVRPIMHEKYQAKIQEIFTLKKEIERSIKKEKFVVDEALKEKLSKIGGLSAEATFYKLEALIKIKSILTPEQWQVWIQQ